MLIVAKLLKTQQNKAWYSFGLDEPLDGTFFVNFSDINESQVEKSSSVIPDKWVVRAICKVISTYQDSNEVPKKIVYCNGG